MLNCLHVDSRISILNFCEPSKKDLVPALASFLTMNFTIKELHYSSKIESNFSLIADAALSNHTLHDIYFNRSSISNSNIKDVLKFLSNSSVKTVAFNESFAGIDFFSFLDQPDFISSFRKVTSLIIRKTPDFPIANLFQNLTLLEYFKIIESDVQITTAFSSLSSSNIKTLCIEEANGTLQYAAQFFLPKTLSSIILSKIEFVSPVLLQLWSCISSHQPDDPNFSLFFTNLSLPFEDINSFSDSFHKIKPSSSVVDLKWISSFLTPKILQSFGKMKSITTLNLTGSLTPNCLHAFRKVIVTLTNLTHFKCAGTDQIKLTNEYEGLIKGFKKSASLTTVSIPNHDFGCNALPRIAKFLISKKNITSFDDSHSCYYNAESLVSFFESLIKKRQTPLNIVFPKFDIIYLQKQSMISEQQVYQITDLHKAVVSGNQTQSHDDGGNESQMEIIEDDESNLLETPPFDYSRTPYNLPKIPRPVESSFLDLYPSLSYDFLLKELISEGTKQDIIVPNETPQ